MVGADVGTGSVAGPVMKGRLVAFIPEDMSPMGRMDIIPSDSVGAADVVPVGEGDASAGVVIGGPGGVTALAERVGVT